MLGFPSDHVSFIDPMKITPYVSVRPPYEQNILKAIRVTPTNDMFHVTVKVDDPSDVVFFSPGTFVWTSASKTRMITYEHFTLANITYTAGLIQNPEEHDSFKWLRTCLFGKKAIQVVTVSFDVYTDEYRV
jgi:hypothetical protein